MPKRTRGRQRRSAQPLLRPCWPIFPDEWLADLKATTLALDLEGTQQVIDRLQDQYPDVASGLRDLVQNFQMGRIQALLAETEA